MTLGLKITKFNGGSLYKLVSEVHFINNNIFFQIGFISCRKEQMKFIIKSCNHSLKLVIQH